MPDHFTLIARMRSSALAGRGISKRDALEAGRLPVSAVPALAAAAHEAALEHHGRRFDVCSIINARSGRCTEDCRYCAQSSHYGVKIEKYPLMDARRILAAARQYEKAGARRFSIVTSGRNCPDGTELDRVCEAVSLIAERTGLSVCASMGLMDSPQARALKSAGLSRYHNNLEACRAFFPRVCTTHTYDMKVRTVRTAQRAGLEVCSGGIVGLGEDWACRVELAKELGALRVDSIPLNVLDPIKGTPMDANVPLGFWEIIRTIAMFRLVNPAMSLRFAGGRTRWVGAERAVAFTAGLSGVMIGDLLTTPGMSPKDDMAALDRLGYDH